MKTMILALAILTAITTHSQNSARALDSLISAEFTNDEPGIAMLVMEKGKPAYRKAFGSASLELKVPLRPDMVFKIGSITKQFTAVAILQLEEKGLLSLTDSIQKYVDAFPFKGHTITIENLLTHTSGIEDYMAIDHPDPYIERHELSPRFIIDHFKNAKLKFEPGTRFSYSNSNYVLLGYILEKLSGMSYHHYLKQNLFAKAGLTHTYFDTVNTIIPLRVTGYTLDRGRLENADYQSATLAYAAGDMMSTLDDLYLWNKALHENKLVKQPTLQRAFTPFTLKNGTKTTYGYGWFIDSTYKLKCIHHEGQVNGFIAAEKYFPDRDIFVAIFTNVKSGEDRTDFSDRRFRLMDKMGKVAVGYPLQKPSKKVPQNIFDSYTGVYQKTYDPRTTITIKKETGYLIARIAGQGTWPLIFRTDTTFELEGIENLTGEFSGSDGRIEQLLIKQGGKTEWKKIK